MGEIISFKMIGMSQFTSGMKARAGRLRKRSVINKRALVLVDRWIQKNFQSQGGTVGGWQKLEASTIAHRRKKGRGAKILQDVGWLKNNWKHFANDRMAVIEAGVPYGIFHDSDKPRRKLPQRKILPRDENVQPVLTKLYKHWVRTVIK